MRNQKSSRHTTEAEDEEMESEKKSQNVFKLFKTERKEQLKQKHEQSGKKSPTRRKAA